MPKCGKDTKSKSKAKTFCLLRWIQDETVSVLPITTTKAGQKVYPGSFGDFKWLVTFYEAEVLKVSGKILDLLLCGHGTATYALVHVSLHVEYA